MLERKLLSTKKDESLIRIINKGLGRWAVVEITYCSFRELGFSSQHPQGILQTFIPYFQGIWLCPLLSLGSRQACVHTSKIYT